MGSVLPKDLFSAEKMLLDSLITNINSKKYSRISSNLKFEGLRIMPVAIRLAQNLIHNGSKTLLLWPDAGAAALAKRDCTELSDKIYTFKEYLSGNSSILNDHLIIAVSPQNYDFEEFEALCERHKEIILMINGKLEDTAVGIGSVARDRRKRFLASWQDIYWLEPYDQGALMRSYPGNWLLFRLDNDGYRDIKEFAEKPDSESIFEALL